MLHLTKRMYRKNEYEIENIGLLANGNTVVKVMLLCKQSQLLQKHYFWYGDKQISLETLCVLLALNFGEA